jgi:CBS domain-containing protein
MNSALLKVARQPAVTLPRDASVMDAVRAMMDHKVGAVVVLDDGRVKGLFTERDLMTRVVAEGRDARTTQVAAVMTTPVVLVDPDASPASALDRMREKHFRHLPIVDANGRLLGMLSMRHLMGKQIERLKQQVGALENYAGTDSIGG